MKTFWKNKRCKQAFFLGTALMIVYFLLRNLPLIFHGAGNILHILRPFLWGAVFAFVLHIPMKQIESHLFSSPKYADAKWKKRRRILAMMLVLFSVVLVLTLILLVLIPQLHDSVLLIIREWSMPSVTDWIKNYLKQYPELLKLTIDWQNQFDAIAGLISEYFEQLVTASAKLVGNLVSGVGNLIIASVFAVYLPIEKEKLALQSKKILYAFVPQKQADSAMEIIRLSYRTFAGFISGQCMDSVILGLLFMISMLIFHIPYAVLIGLVTAIFELIPFAGAIMGCCIGMILIGMESPFKAGCFLILSLILHQIESKFIYPHIVGNSVGLPGIWVLFSITVGGACFGITGMLTGIPLISVFYTLLKQSVNKRLEEKQITIKEL